VDMGGQGGLVRLEQLAQFVGAHVVPPKRPQ
jgi:hypothetical protein